MYKIVGGKVSSNACCLSRSPRLGDISETSKRQIQLKLNGCSSCNRWLNCVSPWHTSLVWGMQKVDVSSKHNWKNLIRGKNCVHDYTNLLWF